MDRRFHIKSLTLKGAVIDLPVRCKIPVAVFRPRRPPDFRICLIVPVVFWKAHFFPEIFCPFSLPDAGLLVSAFIKRRDTILCSPLFVFRVIGRTGRIEGRFPVFVSCICKNTSLLFCPSPAFVKSAYCQHDMCMRIAVALIVQRPISNHAPGNKVFHDIASGTIDLLLSGQFRRESNFDFTRKLCVGALFLLLHLIPETGTVAKMLWRVFRQQDLIHDNAAFVCKVMNESCFLVPELFTGTIRCRSNSGTPARTRYDLNRAMVY